MVGALLDRGRRVRLIGRRLIARWRHNPNVDHLRADISEPDLLEQALDDVGTVFHLAASTSGRNWQTYYNSTVQPTGRLLEYMAGRGGGRIVIVSSKEPAASCPVCANQ